MKFFFFFFQKMELYFLWSVCKKMGLMKLYIPYISHKKKKNFFYNATLSRELHFFHYLRLCRNNDRRVKKNIYFNTLLHWSSKFLIDFLDIIKFFTRMTNETLYSFSPARHNLKFSFRKEKIKKKKSCQVLVKRSASSPLAFYILLSHRNTIKKL